LTHSNDYDLWLSHNSSYYCKEIGTILLFYNKIDILSYIKLFCVNLINTIATINSSKKFRLYGFGLEKNKNTYTNRLVLKIYVLYRLGPTMVFMIIIL